MQFAIRNEALLAQGLGPLEVARGLLEVERLQLNVTTGFVLVGLHQQGVKLDKDSAFFDDLAVLDVNLLNLAAHFGLHVAEDDGADIAGRIDGFLDVADGHDGFDWIERGPALRATGAGTALLGIVWPPIHGSRGHEGNGGENNQVLLKAHGVAGKGGKGSSSGSSAPTFASAVSSEKP